MNATPVLDTRDRSLAAGMHLATIFFPIVAPVVALVIGRESPFLTAHAKQSLKETIIVQSVIFLALACSLTYSLVSLYHQYQEGFKDFSVVPILARLVIGWIVLGILEAVNVFAAIGHALRANRGEWPRSLSTPR